MSNCPKCNSASYSLNISGVPNSTIKVAYRIRCDKCGAKTKFYYIDADAIKAWEKGKVE